MKLQLGRWGQARPTARVSLAAANVCANAMDTGSDNLCRELYIELCVAMLKYLHNGGKVQVDSMVTVDVDNILDWYSRNIDDRKLTGRLMDDNVSLRAAMGYDNFCNTVCVTAPKYVESREHSPL